MTDSTCPFPAPPGFTHNGDCSLLCKSASAKDILLFFVGNYAAHAGTVISRPGQSTLMTIVTLVAAVILPGTGVFTGVMAMMSLAFFAPTELTKAARAGALCIVVKTCRAYPSEYDEEQRTGHPPPVAQHSETAASERVGSAVAHGPPAISESRNELSEPAGKHGGDTNPGIELDNFGQANGQNGHDETQIMEKKPSQVEISQLEDHVRGSRDGEEKMEHSSSLGPGGHMPRRQTLYDEPDEILPPSFSATKIQGITRLPAGCRLIQLPRWTQFENDMAEDQHASAFGDNGQETQASGFGIWLRRTLTSPFRSRMRTTDTIASDYNLIKALISLGQLIFTAITLYETKGNQLERFGYAAPGLTVAPYLWMSFFNLLGNLMCPQYSTMFVVNSPTLDALRKEVMEQGLSDRYSLDNAVGRISQETEAQVLEESEWMLSYSSTIQRELEGPNTESSDGLARGIAFLVAFVAAIIPIAIVGGISKFESGQSAMSERAWTMTWLSCGVVGTLLSASVLPFLESRPLLWKPIMTRKDDERSENLGDDAQAESHADGGQETDGDGRGGSEEESQHEQSGDDSTLSSSSSWKDEEMGRKGEAWVLALFVAASLIYVVPGLGGFVVVAKMLQAYGTCVQIDGVEAQ